MVSCSAGFLIFCEWIRGAASASGKLHQWALVGPLGRGLPGNSKPATLFSESKLPLSTYVHIPYTQKYLKTSFFDKID